MILPFLNLIRYKNLVVLLITQVLVKYALFAANYAITSLSDIQFMILSLSTICIAAAGYVINDIYDIETDLINRPDKVIVGKDISEKQANTLFIGLNVMGVLLGFYLSHNLGKPSFFALFVIISALLYVYASYLKQTFLIGNLAVSLLISISMIIVGIFDLLPPINHVNRELQLSVFKILLVYAFFAFFINLLREITKDIQDIDGDHKAGMHTLPIVLGRHRAKNILFILSVIFILLVIYLLANYLYNKTTLLIYALMFIIGPLIFTSIKIFNAERKKDYKSISNLFKLVMVFGVLSMLLHTTFLE